MAQAETRLDLRASDAVVLHDNGQLPVLTEQIHFNPGGMSVADGIGHALLHNAVHRILLIRGQPHIGRLHRKFDVGMRGLLHLLTHLDQRFGQLEPFERIRPQSADRPAHLVDTGPRRFGDEFHLFARHFR